MVLEWRSLNLSPLTATQQCGGPLLGGRLDEFLGLTVAPEAFFEEAKKGHLALKGYSYVNNTYYGAFSWVAVKELEFSYYNPETILLAIYPYYGNII